MKRQETYSAGLYLRLSKDDIGTGDSSSIISQKTMLEKYVRDNDWKIHDCYVDDGYTGTNFNRPDFQRMLEDIELGNLNMVVVKDLSRLGRNYLITGQYIDIYFPDRGVRFIALNDGIDTIDADNDIVPFKNILNEMYSKDISKKVRSAVRTKKQRGEFLSNHAPYGYIKDPVDKHRLIIEESGAVVVRQIYDMCAANHGTPYIAKMLNEQGILSPRNHHEKICPGYYKTPQRKYGWNTESIHHILRSRIYKGDMVQGIYDCARFKRTPSKRKPTEEWYITPNTHEPIIEEGLWHYVQQCLDSRKRVMSTGKPQLFSGFIKCADCGYALSYAKKFGTEYYSCGQYRRKGLDYCTQHYINKQVLIEAVLDDIRRYARLAKDDIEDLALRLAELHGEKEAQQHKVLLDELSSSEARFEELDRIIEQLYEDKVSGELTESRYRKLSEKYETEQEALKKSIEGLQFEIGRQNANRRDISTWLELIREYAEIQELDRTILGELVEKITVGETEVIDGKKNIEIMIYYRFMGLIRL